ncbi:MAG TPA: hypothetical protein VMQ86_20625 [Bryobacteraceae bacterium]|jgi:hypothetical protein|nr:hypothetical protein [Bryobacteraceae bacterium]
MGQSGTNSFTTYLEEKQRWEKAKRVTPAAAGTVFSVLSVLGASAGACMPLPDLQASSGFSFTDFAEAIKRLEEMGYITLRGAPGSESAQLTELGVDVASLARPA